MSLILDALKKSETERQQQATPGIADVPTAQPQPSSSRWLPIVIVLLAVNFGAVLFLLLRPDSPTEPATTMSVAPAAPEAQAAAANASSNQSIANPVDSAPAATATPAAAPSASPPAPVENPVAEVLDDAAAETQATLAQSAEPTSSAPPAPDTTEAAVADAPGTASSGIADGNQPAESSAPSAGSTGSYLTINDLRAGGNFNVPEMHIDLHVFSDNPAERFVFINMNQYRENATTEEGPRVREITTEGVILEHRGSVFLLPRE